MLLTDSLPASPLPCSPPIKSICGLANLTSWAVSSPCDASSPTNASGCWQPVHSDDASLAAILQGGYLPAPWSVDVSSPASLRAKFSVKVRQPCGYTVLQRPGRCAGQAAGAVGLRGIFHRSLLPIPWPIQLEHTDTTSAPVYGSDGRGKSPTPVAAVRGGGGGGWAVGGGGGGGGGSGGGCAVGGGWGGRHWLQQHLQAGRPPCRAPERPLTDRQPPSRTARQWQIHTDAQGRAVAGPAKVDSAGSIVALAGEPNAYVQWSGSIKLESAALQTWMVTIDGLRRTADASQDGTGMR